MSIRRFAFLIAAGLAFGAAPACIDDDLTLDAPCSQGSDCLGDQSCIVTDVQLAEVDGYGQCKDSDTCEVGVQPGCACEPNLDSDSVPSCSGLRVNPKPACRDPQYDRDMAITADNSPFLTGDALEMCRADPATLEDCLCIPNAGG